MVAISEIMLKLQRSGIDLSLEPSGRIRIVGDVSDEQLQVLRRDREAVVRALQPERSILEYRFADDPPDRWYIMLGRTGDSYEATAAACRRMFFKVVETRPRYIGLPIGFPFSTPCPACDGSGCDTCGESDASDGEE